jgi:glutamine---fructose-6-phosphate transaminase (isomerizing)
VGIGHTRWATHGRPSDENAHPHKAGPISVVHNGIIENHVGLRVRLKAAGRTFTSETDTEIVAHLIDEALKGGASNLADAVRKALRQVEGAYALVVLSDDHPDEVIAAKDASPLVVGLGKGENFLASDVPALLEHTRDVLFLEDGDVAVLSRNGVSVTDLEGRARQRTPKTITWSAAQAEKAGYPHFMLKEIHEQPRAVTDTLRGRLLPDKNDAFLDGFEAGSQVRRVVLLACGTSYHAGLVGRYAIEWWSRLPVEMDIASEFRYRNPVLDEHDLVIGISQSGETADTLAAMRLARERGATVLAITNIQGSQATRDSDGVLFTRAGLEIGVAASKTFVAQVAAMYLFALKLAELRGQLEPDVVARLCAELRTMPHSVATLVDGVDEQIRAIAEHWKDAGFFLYLGRHVGLPICLEGALKLKELSYIPTDAYAAGEMKHGPISLLDERTPVVCVATDSPVLDKVLSNIAEVRARGAHVIAVATEGSGQVAEHAEEVVEVPRTDWLLQPLLAVIPLQLLAYYIARARGLNIDQPRNLAKTVTVE